MTFPPDKISTNSSKYFPFVLDLLNFYDNVFNYYYCYFVMDEQQIKEIIEQLESKQKDCIAFSKKYQQRKMDDLHQYYEGALWALKFTLALFNEKK